QEAEDAARRRDPQRLANADRRAERAAEQRAERPDPVVHDEVGAADARAQLARHDRREDRAGTDVEDHHAEPRPELGEEEEREDAKLKQWIVAGAPSAVRIVAERRMNRTPATTCPLSPPEVGASSGSIPRRNHADPRNETASTASAYGADSACTRPPATLGPATNENARLPENSDCASTYRSRWVIDAMSELWAT